MKPAILLAVMLTLGLLAQSQPIISKIANGVSEAERVNGTLGKFKGLLPKKKDKAKDTVSVAKSNTKMTVLTVEGIDFPKLKALNEAVKACSGVTSTNMKFGTPSKIEISHTGTTEAIMKLIGEAAKDIYTDKNIESFEEGSVKVKL